MQVSTHIHHGNPLLRFEGPITPETVEDFRLAIQRCIDQGHTQITLDFQRVDSFCSLGIGVTSNLLRVLRKQNGKLTLIGVSEEIRRLFQFTRLDQYVELRAAEDGAVGGGA